MKKFLRITRKFLQINVIVKKKKRKKINICFRLRLWLHHADLKGPRPVLSHSPRW